MLLFDNATSFFLFPADCNSLHYTFHSWQMTWHKEDALRCRESHLPTSFHHILNLSYHVPQPDCPSSPFSIQKPEWPSQTASLSMSPPILNILWETSHVALDKPNFPLRPTRPVWPGPWKLLQLVSYHASSTSSPLTSFRPSNRGSPDRKLFPPVSNHFSDLCSIFTSSATLPLPGAKSDLLWCALKVPFIFPFH